MKRNLNTCIRVINNGTEVMYANIEEAMMATGLTKRQLELRATSESVNKGTLYKWCESSTRRSYLGKRSRRKGNNWELEVINKLREIGYKGCVSSRSESRRMDDAKVDIVDTDNELPCHIQAKNTKNLPNYDKIEKECPIKDKPFVIVCKQVGKQPVAILPVDFFYELIRKK